MYSHLLVKMGNLYRYSDMTKEEYKEHLCEIVQMVFTAEDAVIRANPEMLEKMEKREIEPQEYVELIAEEILNNVTCEFE